MMCTGEGCGTPVRVLVADWDRNNALSLAAAMHRSGFSTATAFNGKEAVEKAQTFRPHLLVTEAYLGRLSGIQAAARITAALPDCKVLFVSGEASLADIGNAAPEGLVYSYARKPIDPINLLNAIACMLWPEWQGVIPGPWSRTQPEQRPVKGRSALNKLRQPRETKLRAPSSSGHYFSARN